jgi:KDO2-lipid IV(A) lauroyltransferase
MQHILVFVIRYLPLPLLHLIAWPLGWLLYITHNKQRHIAEVNLQLCFPGWPEKKRHQLVRQSLVETAKTILESLKLWQCSEAKILGYIKNISGRELLDNKEHGIILIIPHLGNWEMVGLYCSGKMPMTSMYRQQKSAYLNRIMTEGRQRLGAHLVPATNKGVKHLLQALNKNELIAVLPDQNPSKGMQMFVPFFNVMTNTPVLPVRLAQKTGATIILAYAERLPRGQGYNLFFESVSDELCNENLELATKAMNKELEDLIREKPQQYWWGYSRFRQRPEGEAKLYNKD